MTRNSKSIRSLLSGALVVATFAVAQTVTAAPASDTIASRGGALRITPKFHGSFQIAYAGKIIEVDPVSAASYTRKADVILVTHAHGDHFDKAAIAKLATPDTHIVVPKVVEKQLRPVLKSESLMALENGRGLKLTVGNSGREVAIFVQAVPMYNVVRERAKGQKFHPRGEGNGYIISLGGKRIYVAGDTEGTPEMRALKNIDIAFLPMNLPFTMTPPEAAGAVRAFRPKIVYPYHFRYPFDKPNANAQQFATALKGSGVLVRLRDWYPAAAVARATAAAKK